MEYHIALAGTFDVENYGDLMFPIIFERAMKARGLDFEVVLFSPSDKAPEALDNSRMVYSFKDFEELNEKYNFDALVVGGGALIRFDRFEVLLPNHSTKSRYYSIHSWLSLIYFASEHNIKVLFNCPQAPYRFPDELGCLARAAFDQVDYLTVRDSFSKEYIEEIYKNDKKKPKILVYPDTVCVVNELFDVGELEKRRIKLLKSNDKYMVLHFQYANDVPESTLLGLKKITENAKGHGLKVVLLPIGYTHGDAQIMEKFREKHSKECIFLEEKLDIEDMTAILAGCQYYVGMSFHGAVVAMAFGKDAYSTNLGSKNRELYGSFDREECLQEDYGGIIEAIESSDKKKSDLNIQKKKISKAVNDHFDNVYRYIVDVDTKRKTPKLLLGEVFNAISRLEEVYRAQVMLKGELGEKEKALIEYKRMEKMILDENRKIREDLILVRKSRSFKVGKAILWLPGKIKNLTKMIIRRG